MSLHYIESVPGGWQVYEYTRHNVKVYVGPVWPDAGAASRYVDLLDEAALGGPPSRREPADLAPGEVMELWGK